MDRETPQRVYGLTIRLPSKEAGIQWPELVLTVLKQKAEALEVMLEERTEHLAQAADLYIPDVKALWRDPQRALGLGGLIDISAMENVDTLLLAMTKLTTASRSCLERKCGSRSHFPTHSCFLSAKSLNRARRIASSLWGSLPAVTDRLLGGVT